MTTADQGTTATTSFESFYSEWTTWRDNDYKFKDLISQFVINYIERKNLNDTDAKNLLSLLKGYNNNIPEYSNRNAA